MFQSLHPLNQVRADQQQETQEKQYLRSWTGWNFHAKCDTIFPREERNIMASNQDIKKPQRKADEDLPERLCKRGKQPLHPFSASYEFT